MLFEWSGVGEGAGESIRSMEVLTKTEVRECVWVGGCVCVFGSGVEGDFVYRRLVHTGKTVSLLD